jgi:hypothetical protein
MPHEFGTSIRDGMTMMPSGHAPITSGAFRHSTINSRTCGRPVLSDAPVPAPLGILNALHSHRSISPQCTGCTTLVTQGARETKLHRWPSALAHTPDHATLVFRLKTCPRTADLPTADGTRPRGHQVRAEAPAPHGPTTPAVSQLGDPCRLPSPALRTHCHSHSQQQSQRASQVRQ